MHLILTICLLSSNDSGVAGDSGIGAYLALTGARVMGRDIVAANLSTHYLRSSRIEHLEGVVAEMTSQALQKQLDTADLALIDRALTSLDSIDTEHLVPPTQDGLDKKKEQGKKKAEAKSYLERCRADIESCFGNSSSGYTLSVAEIAARVNTLAATQKAAALANAKLGQDPQSQWRDPADHWAVTAAEELSLASPTALVVAHESLRRGSQMDSMAEALQMEYRVARRMIRHPDFLAGARALIKCVLSRCAHEFLCRFVSYVCGFDLCITFCLLLSWLW